MKTPSLLLKIIFFITALVLFDALQAQVVTITYGSPATYGTDTATVPNGSISVFGYAWGAGGGGGGALACGPGTGCCLLYRSAAGASAGGGGGYSTQDFENNTGSFSIIVGKGGRGTGSENGNGTNGIECNPTTVTGAVQYKECRTGEAGGDSKITYSSTTVTAGGGGGGKSAAVDANNGSVSYASTNGGAGGSGNVGAGGIGGQGSASASGTSGSGSCPSASGGTGGTVFGANPNNGGPATSFSGGSNSGSVRSSSAGNNGGFPGGGGGGAYAIVQRYGTPDCNGGNGGNGGNGQVIITYTLNAPVISDSAVYCEGDTITLTSSYGAGNGVTLQWYNGSTAISGATGQILTISNCAAADAGIYTVKATVNVSYSTAAEVKIASTVQGNKTVNVTLTSNEITITINQPSQSPIIPISICEGQSYTGNGFTNISTAGLHTRVISGGNAAGCDSTVRINLTIHPKPSNISQEYEDVCPKATSQMVTWASLVGTYTGILHWYTTETGGSEILEPAAFDASSDFTATYWVSQTTGGCETSRTQVYVNINEAPVPTIVPAEVCQQTGTKEWNTVVVPQSGETIHWYTDVSIANAEYAGRNLNPAFVFSGNTMPLAQDLSVTGTYTIWVILERDATGCHSVVSPVEIVVNAAPTVNLLSEELCEHTPGDLIQIEFTGRPDFTLNYSVDVAGVGNDLDPVTLGFPTVFGNGQPGVATWTGSGNNWSAGISTVVPGFFNFNVVSITDGTGCQSTRP
ncbi:hypothetical protein FACS1894178_7500 [Bacteroidia bacterium]|nr:hypothetical protein FACS1894178_7500 [Bacteroidia bacterium]